jgi:choline kinase
MKALILAAGQGTRLRPLTDDRPKCMVELGGVPLLHRQLAALAEAGLTDVSVVVGYHADRVAAPGIELISNDRYATTNMVSSLFCAESVFRSGEDILLSYGDIVCEPRLIREVAKSRAALAVAVDLDWRKYWELRFDNPLDDAETLRLRADGTIAEIGQKPAKMDEIQAQYLGLLKISAAGARDLLAAYRRLRQISALACDRMFMTDFLQYLIVKGYPVHAVPVRHGWLEIDRLFDIELYERGALRAIYDDAFLLEPDRASTRLS